MRGVWCYWISAYGSQELLRQWPGVYGDNERIAFNIPSWNTTTYVTCSDFDCVIVFVNFFITLYEGQSKSSRKSFADGEWEIR